MSPVWRYVPTARHAWGRYQLGRPQAKTPSFNPIPDFPTFSRIFPSSPTLMIDPITPSVPVYWQGKTYKMQLTLGALAGASGRLKIPILEGGENSLNAMPELAQRAVILYAALHRKFPGVTLAECEDALFDPTRFKHYEDACAALMQGVIPHIEAIRKEQEKHRPPTAAQEAMESSGGDSGQSA